MAMLVHIDNKIATVTIARPEAMNALDPETLQSLNEAFQKLNMDDEVRAVILTGAGEFCVLYRI